MCFICFYVKFIVALVLQNVTEDVVQYAHLYGVLYV